MTKDFDPNSAAGDDSGIFGLPYSEDESKIVIIPVPWEATVSYGAGTSKGPKVVLEASRQVDLFDLELGEAFRAGYFLQKTNKKIEALGKKVKRKSPKIVNKASDEMNEFVYQEAKKILKKNKIPAVLGGDHSSPYGLIKAISENIKGNFGILHIDAHADLRTAYEGYTWSHASIMYNVMTSTFAPKKLVQVGIRDFCSEEHGMIQRSSSRIQTFFDLDLKKTNLAGDNWTQIADEIVNQLPENVYVSFDIDGLDPTLCPGTGTPVPGGLQFHEALALLSALKKNKKKIIGFDLNEVAPGTDNNEWNGNVGARILYKLCGWTAVTNGLT